MVFLVLDGLKSSLGLKTLAKLLEPSLLLIFGQRSDLLR
jgi:hypothetical protein